MEGTDNAEAVRGSLTEGDGYINGHAGDDVIYGTDRNEILVSEGGDSLLVAGGGNDQIWVVGAGNDILDGGTGNDTYLFRRGSGQDTIIDPKARPDTIDTTRLGDIQHKKSFFAVGGSLTSTTPSRTCRKLSHVSTMLTHNSPVNSNGCETNDNVCHLPGTLRLFQRFSV
ncbi:MAG TPA: hypothetical protein VK463_20220 [Desulfomonilaceae bacterium]|nr:hypothetical protein [Desulfomonilaceae bacterium]